MLQILAPGGTLSADPPVDVDTTRDLFGRLVAARAYDTKCEALQKQGRLATYASFRGQEAAQVGSAAALLPDDWMVGSYRDAAAMWCHGYPWVNLILGRSGDERGGSPPAGIRVLPPSITVGAHMLHAVGLAWGERLKGSTAVAITYFGDGATSEGDFHEAMNFAGVYETPTIFLCQNNGWAISMPRSRQTASATIAQKADAYGFDGEQVDGNDLFAVYSATREAIAKARAGLGPTLIEAVTYRINPHTTSDDPARYRDAEEAAAWAGRDPLERIRAYLQAADAWDPTWEAGLEEEAAAGLEDSVAAAEAMTGFEPEEVFGAMFAIPTSQLEDQARLLAQQRGADG